MDNVFLISFLFWPLVVLVCAGINMLVSWTFSWSELVFDYLAGVLMGYFLWAAATGNANGAENFFFVFSHGLFGLIYVFSDGLRDAFGSVAATMWAFAGLRVGATLWCAALDHGSSAFGARLDWGPFFFSFLLAPAKMSFALITSGVGFLIWCAGVVMAIAGKAKAGFAGGTLFTEFSPGSGGHHATTLGSTVHAWHGGMPFKHELYHTRQYIYLSDWLIPFWCLGTLWGLTSAAISKNHSPSQQTAFGANGTDEVGNPLEIAAYRLG